MKDDATTTASGGGVRAWLELMRLSNLPTCFTNVLVGVALGREAAFSWSTCIGVSVAIALLYVGGMALNDVVDAQIDETDRSRRPIPSGRIARRDAFIFSLATLVLGSGGLAFFGVRAFLWGLALLSVIVIYDLVHKRFAAAVLLMGACRGLVYVVSAVAANPAAGDVALITVATLMTVYIAAVTLVARGEHTTDRPRSMATRLLFMLPLVPLAAAAFLPPPNPERAVLIGMVLVIWMGRSAFLLGLKPPRPKDAVMGWLAAICLIDAYWLVLLHHDALSYVAVGLFVLTWLGHRRIMGT